MLEAGKTSLNKGSVKSRLAQYQEAALRKKEFENKARVKVEKLDDDKKNISRFDSPTRGHVLVRLIYLKWWGGLAGIYWMTLRKA